MRKIITCLILCSCLSALSGCGSKLNEDIAGTTETLSGGDSSDVSSSDGSGESAEVGLPDFQIEYAADRVNLTDYQALYAAEADEVKAGNYDKIDFSDCEMFSFESVEQVGVYRIYSDVVGVDESIEMIKDWLDGTDCGDIDLNKELRDASGQYEDSSAEYPYNYPAVYDYYPDFNSGRGFFINTDRCYIQMGDDGIYSMSDGSITEYIGADSLAAMDALGINEENVVDTGSVSDKADDVWKLAGGQVSVSDAAAYVKEYFEAGTPRENPEGISVDVPYVEVFTAGDTYGYMFMVRRVYNGVPFAYSSTGNRTYYSEDYIIDEDIKHAYMINGDSVAAFTGYNEAEKLEALTEEQTEIISFKDAALMLDEFLADNVQIKADRVEFVYCAYVDTDGNTIIYPCWQVMGINAVNSDSMRLYVNALSGDIYYYSYLEE